jgi:putative tricarboxylic transport membrane protein
MVKKEWVLSLAMLLVGTAITVESARLGLGSIHRPGIGFLPFFTGLALSLAALGSLLNAFLTTRRSAETKSDKLFGPSILNAVAIFAALVIYVFLLGLLGFLASTFLLLVFLFKAGGFRRWSVTLAAALLTVAISQLVFCYWLSMRFPKGLLGF